MDRLIVANKLESLRRCVQRIEDKRTDSVEQLVADIDRQDIIVLNLSRAVQICVDIAAHLLAETREPAPGTMAETFDTIAHAGIIDAQTAQELRSAVGFRNIAVHAYREMDWAVVRSICDRHLQVFRRFAQDVARYCQL